MKKWILLLSLAIALCVVVGGMGLADRASATAQTYTLDWSVIGGGGNASAQLSSTIGQTAIGWSTGSQQLGSGFWYGVDGAAEYKIYLPIVQR